jgi:hypothetical protein
VENCAPGSLVCLKTVRSNRVNSGKAKDMNKIYANPEPIQNGNVLAGVTSTKGPRKGFQVGSLRAIEDDQRPGPHTKGMMCSDLAGNR